MLENLKFCVVIFNEDGRWIAQCIEHDICIQCDSIGEIRERFSLALEVELWYSTVKCRIPSTKIAPAPARLQKEWRQRSQFEDENRVDLITRDGKSITLQFSCGPYAKKGPPIKIQPTLTEYLTYVQSNGCIVQNGVAHTERGQSHNVKFVINTKNKNTLVSVVPPDVYLLSSLVEYYDRRLGFVGWSAPIDWSSLNVSA